MALSKKQPLWFLLACPMLAVYLTATSCTCESSPKDESQVLRDNWSLMKMAGDEVGWVHEKVTQNNDGGLIRYKIETASHMEIKRFGQTVTVAVEAWSLEDEKGSIIEMHQKSMLSGSETVYDLKVEGEKAEVTITTMGKPRKTEMEWNSEVYGFMGAWLKRKANGLKPGLEYAFDVFNFDLGNISSMTVKNVDWEETELLDGDQARLFRTVSSVDILPALKTNEFISEDLNTLKSSVSMMGIKIESYFTTEERAKSWSSEGLKADMIIKSMATANVNLPSPYTLDSILYEFKAKDSELGLPEKLDDLRQRVLKREGDTAKVLIKVIVPEHSQDRPLTDPPDELAEYLEPNAFIQSDDPALSAKANELVRDEKNAWKAACILERFVFEYIEDKNMSTGFASAAEVFHNPKGDCSEHGVLLAALCRAAGIPARVAVGYMYLGGIFGGHMWAEVWIDGGWYPIDGVMGIGRVDPTHICFTQSSLKDGGIAEAFASALTGLGNLDITVIEFTKGGNTIQVGKEFQDYLIEGDTYTNTLYGISITKPEGYTFADYEREFTGVSFNLVEMEGESDARLSAHPATFSQTLDDFKKSITQMGMEILSELPRKVDGRKGIVMTIENDGDTHRVLALIDGDTIYRLRMRIEEEDEERDILAFETMVKSIRFK